MCRGASGDRPEVVGPQPAERWTPCAPALFYLALVRARDGSPEGRFEVEAIERRVVREREDGA
ncbi:hypothetical protein AB0P17_25440 [Streptomyces sp. NPDC088124]|uniref:hypothetical protein n=1 Tax=Streptomyces sp. NPDC088124 TaxID=3154654 RepID=UPI00344320FC